MKRARELLTRLWSVGTTSVGPFEARQVVLVNQLGLLGAAATLLYQVFYLLYDIRLLLQVFLANLVFLSGYLSVFYINHIGRLDEARKVGLATVYLQLYVITALLGAGSGVHLYYFTLCGVVYFMLPRARVPDAAVLLVLAVVFYVICHFAFKPETAVVRLPVGVLDALYAGSAVGAMVLAGIGSYLIRLDIHNSEKRLAQINRELKALSRLDSLTGLANRRGLDECLRREWKRMARHRQPLSAFMCDVDSFKEYNDERGHLAGDACLQGVAVALQRAVGRPVDFVGRFGGDEFMVVLPETGVEGAAHVAEKARQAVAALAIRRTGWDTASYMTLSVGISTVHPQHNEGVDALVEHADLALYMAKSSGRNRSIVCVPGDVPYCPTEVSDRSRQRSG